MKKIIALGDTHGRQFWKQIVNTQEYDKLVFMGDYFDSFDITGELQINNFLDIIEFKKNSIKEVVLLIGNHDLHYFYGIGDTGTSGFQPGAAPSIGWILEDNKHHLTMAHKDGKLLFSHAGIGECFMDDCFGKDGWTMEGLADDVNELWKYKPLAFVFNGRDFSGDDMGQTPVWIRPRSLRKDSQLIKKAGYIQVVGHTGRDHIDLQNDKYYFIDTLHGSIPEYLIIENGKFKRGVL